MSPPMSICLFVVALQATVIFAGLFEVIENYIPEESDEGVFKPYPNEIVVDPFHFTDIEGVQLQESFSAIDLDSNDDLKLHKALLQIEKDEARIPDPSFRTEKDLKIFQSQTKAILDGVVQKLSQPDHRRKFKYIRGSDLEYVQGWDRLASAIAHNLDNTSLNRQVDFFLERLDTKHGLLLNPKNYLSQYDATYMFLNNVNNELQTGFDADDIDSFHLDFVKSFGVEYFSANVFDWVFFQSLQASDPFLFWMELSVSIACHPRIRRIKFTPEDVRNIPFEEIIPMALKSSRMKLDQEVKRPPFLTSMLEDKDCHDTPDFHSQFRAFLKQAFPQEPVLAPVDCELDGDSWEILAS